MLAIAFTMAARQSKLVKYLPFLCFTVESFVATFFYFYPTYADYFIRTVFRYLLAFNVTLAGLAQFSPSMYTFYNSMVFLPAKAFWVYASGAALTVFGIALFIPAIQYLAAQAVAVTLVLVFPANLACVVLPYPRKVVCGGSKMVALARLPIQATFFAWALWLSTPQ